MAQRVLVIDDDAALCALLESGLSRAGYAVSTVECGREGLASVARDMPDLVVLDLIMPEVDGFAVLHALRQNHETRLLPVVILSGRADHAGKLDGFMGGAHLYLTKPCTVAAVVEAVHKLLGSPEASPAGEPVDPRE
jgi:DNA-binding response OmpR family regulator